MMRQVQAPFDDQNHCGLEIIARYHLWLDFRRINPIILEVCADKTHVDHLNPKIDDNNRSHMITTELKNKPPLSKTTSSRKCGNHLRLIAFIQFSQNRIYVKHIVNHADYDKLCQRYQRGEL